MEASDCQNVVHSTTFTLHTLLCASHACIAVAVHIPEVLCHIDAGSDVREKVVAVSGTALWQLLDGTDTLALETGVPGVRTALL